MSSQKSLSVRYLLFTRLEHGAKQRPSRNISIAENNYIFRSWNCIGIYSFNIKYQENYKLIIILFKF